MSTLDIASPASLSPSVLGSWLGRLTEPTARDRRAHERQLAHELEWLKSARLRFGPLLSLIDLSAGGALFETSAPLRPGSTAVLTITGRGVAETASFRVLRCEVASLEQGLVYRGACVFDRTIQIPGSSSSQGSRRPADPTGPDEEVLELIRSVAGRLSDPAAEGKQLRLMQALRSAVERGESPTSVLRYVDRELGARTKTFAAAEPAAGRESTPVTTRGPARSAARPAPAPSPAPQPVGGAGWNKLVVRYLDGTVLKGYSQNFHPSRATFHLAASVAMVAERPSLVPMRQLKAVFFVRDFSGNPDYVDSRSFAERTPGRRIEVTFVDGELLVGSTLGYRPDGTGFFVRPADTDGNNLRIFVLPGAVKRVRYL